MEIGSYVTDKIWSAVLTKFTDQKAFMLQRNFLYMANCYFGSDYERWKMIFLKKYMEIWYFIQMFWKDGLSKKKSHWNMMVHVLSGKIVCFYPKIRVFFFLDGKWKMIFLKNAWKYDNFLYICINVTDMILPFF